MIDPNDNELVSIARLSLTEDGRDLISFIKKCIDTESTKIVYQEDDVLMRWKQGRLQELLDFYSILVNASERLKQVASSKGRRNPDL